MNTRRQSTPQESHLRSTLLQDVANLPLIKGGIYRCPRTCGKNNCRCARGQKHVSCYLHVHQNGKLKAIAIPKEMEYDFRQAVENYQRVQQKRQTLANAQLQRMRDEKQARGHTRATS